MSAELLKRGDVVTLLDEPGQPKVLVEVVGALGFKPQGRVAIRWWADRGKTWASEKLDRQDAASARFKRSREEDR